MTAPNVAKGDLQNLFFCSAMTWLFSGGLLGWCPFRVGLQNIGVLNHLKHWCFKDCFGPVWVSKPEVSRDQRKFL